MGEKYSRANITPSALLTVPVGLNAQEAPFPVETGPLGVMRRTGPWGGAARPSYSLRAKRVNELRELALVVSSFVFVDDALLGQAVQHRRHFLQQVLSGRFVGGGAQLFDGRAGRFVLVAVQYALGFVAADALESRLVVCNDKKNYKNRP